MFRAGVVFIFGCAALLAWSPAQAKGTRYLGFHGVLDTITGKPQTGPTTFQFSIYDHPTAIKAPLWSSPPRPVTVDKRGLFDVKLGEKETIPAGLFTNAPLYLEITVQSSTLSPRQEILSVPHALAAPSSAKTAGGGFTINGAVEIDASFGESFSLQLAKAAKSVTLFFRGAAFSAFHYTELPHHSHTISGSVKVANPTCSSAGGHRHTLSGSTAAGTSNCGAAGNHSHTVSGSTKPGAVSCASYSHDHTVGGTTGATNPTHIHRIQVYDGNAPNPVCKHGGGCSTSGTYGAGYYLSQTHIFPSAVTCAAAPGGTCQYGMVANKPPPGWGATYRYGTSANEGGTHTHPWSGRSSVASFRPSCSSSAHTFAAGSNTTGTHSHSCSGHSHTLSGSTAAAAAHSHSCTIGAVSHSLSGTAAGIKSGMKLSSSVKTFPNQVRVLIDGQDCTSDVERLANAQWGTTGKKLGDGTASHPFVTRGTGQLDFGAFTSCTAPLTKAQTTPHTVRLVQAGGAAGGGKVEYIVSVVQ